jgi:hypothetical protein
MNKRQLIALWVGIGVLAVMGVFPPWVRSFSGAGPRLPCETAAIYAPIFWPPASRKGAVDSWDCDTGSVPSFGVRVDTTRLLVQWFLVGMVTGGLILSLRTRTGR